MSNLENLGFNESSNNHSWICAQIGSREHYSIPRALHQSGRLRLFLTDFWADRGGIWRWMPASQRRKVEERFDPELADAPVFAPGCQRLLFDASQKVLNRTPWETTLARNEWFQETMLRHLQGRFRDMIRRTPPGTFFSYSYAARKLLRFFRSEGWRTVLGQIDPGPREERIVACETERERGFSTGWNRAPAVYWDRWREECDLADEIWVNSRWSSEALIGEGIPEGKLRTVPLVYSKPREESDGHIRTYPECFTQERPLRVLFLGQINIRKGAHLLLRAARRLAADPFHFWMVGPTDLHVPEEFLQDPRFLWTGPVSRKQTAEIYRNADLFILPTLSDGFALTQFEAQARGLPLLASRFCGEVVQDGKNGLLLDPLSEDTIVEKLRYCLNHPAALGDFSRHSHVPPRFQLGALQDFLDKQSRNEIQT